MNATVELQRRVPAPPPRERAALERRAKLLAWGGNAWHLVEFAIALAAGVAAGSVALIGFGLDSLIELAAGGVVIQARRIGAPPPCCGFIRRVRNGRRGAAGRASDRSLERPRSRPHTSKPARRFAGLLVAGPVSRPRT